MVGGCGRTLDAALIGSDRGALDTDVVLLDGLRRLNSDLVR